jgi:exopolysaccharide biosynthesis polyprenyl glycosylphosphotransferase
VKRHSIGAVQRATRPRVEPSASAAGQEILTQEAFHRMIALERKRTERSRKPFLLMLLDTGAGLPSPRSEKLLLDVLDAVTESTREIDLVGWYATGAVVGVMFTELVVQARTSIIGTIMNRMSEALRKNLSLEQFNQIKISFHLFPEDWDHQSPDRPSNPTLYPDLENREKHSRAMRIVKRSMDVAGSLFALIVLSPLFVTIAAAIKLTSKGPVFFKQKRVGRYGKCFTFLKFRSMHVNNDASQHKEYVRQLIAGEADPKPVTGNGKGIYKLTEDKRITTVGRIIRRTSLDELPQFFNVLWGDMSLVGPRPPIPYEVEAYDIWHRRRVLEAKPGITGLWQVHGRSRVAFDEMVRLDLRYARNWSPWLDLKILLQTPKAVWAGDGAC